MQTACSVKNLKKIRIKILIIYFLNITDIVFTLVFQKTGFFIELNPLMNSIIRNDVGAIALKSLLPAVLFGFLLIRMKSANAKQLVISNRVVSVALVFYTVINIMHLISFMLFKSTGIL